MENQGKYRFINNDQYYFNAKTFILIVPTGRPESPISSAQILSQFIFINIFVNLTNYYQLKLSLQF